MHPLKIYSSSVIMPVELDIQWLSSCCNFHPGHDAIVMPVSTRCGSEGELASINSAEIVYMPPLFLSVLSEEMQQPKYPSS